MAKINLDGLLKKGFSEEKADIVLASKLAWKDLQHMSNDELTELLGEGADYYIKIVRDSGRPDIDDMVYYNLMYECNRTCCICKNDTRPIVIHHIDPWEVSYSHEPENLVVLCVLHHADAHRGLQNGQGLLERKLSAEEVRNHKRRWLEEVKEGNRRCIQGLINDKDQCDWIYFNPRFFELVKRSKVNVKMAENYDLLLQEGVIDGYGIPKPEIMSSDKSYWTEGKFIVHLNVYMSSLAKMTSHSLDFINLNRDWSSKEELLDVLSNNNLVVLQHRFYFRDDQARTNKASQGYGQLRIGHLGRTIKDVVFEFTHDLYHCTSSSAKYTHLSGNNEITIFANIRTPVVEEEKVIIKPTVYAIGLWFKKLGNKFSVQ